MPWSKVVETSIARNMKNDGFPILRQRSEPRPGTTPAAVPGASDGQRFLRALFLGAIMVWFLTTGSSCQTTVGNGSGTVAASGAAAGLGVAAFLAGGIVYCAVDTENCFPDEAALQARYEAYTRAQARFTAGLRRYRAGDPEGLRLICRSAHDGYANAQYFYASHLLRAAPARHAAAVHWLERAASQGHRMADLRLHWATDPPGPSSGANRSGTSPPSAVPPCAPAPERAREASPRLSQQAL